jgi:hypothetical protein
MTIFGVLKAVNAFIKRAVIAISKKTMQQEIIASFLVLQSTFPLRFGINLVFYASIHRYFLSTA